MGKRSVQQGECLRRNRADVAFGTWQGRVCQVKGGQEWVGQAPLCEHVQAATVLVGQGARLPGGAFSG